MFKALIFPTCIYSGEISFLVSDVTVNNWFSMVTMTFTRRRSAALGKNAPEDIELPALPDETPESKLRVFTFEQLKTAAFDFRSDMLLGKGGFGSVYCLFSVQYLEENCNQVLQRRLRRITYFSLMQQFCFYTPCM